MLTTNNIDFIIDGGEMGTLIRQKNWHDNPLGDPQKWPQSLRTTLGVILNSNFPMFLWWGTELICFYNDAYRPSLGENGKHPTILGLPAKQAWPEIWEIIEPLIKKVLSGEPVWSEDKLIPIYRNGRIEDVYWTFSYGPLYDENKVAGILITCAETTEKVNAIKAAKEREDQLNFTIEAAELATWDLNLITNKFLGNDRLKEWLGFSIKDEIDLNDILSRIIDKDRQRVIDEIQTALQPASGGAYNVEYTVLNPKTNVERLVVAKGKALFNKENLPYRFSGILQDISQQNLFYKKVEESEKRFKNVADSAPVLIWMAGTDKLCNFFNKAWLNFVGRTIEQEAGNGWAEGVHPDDFKRCLDIYVTSFDKREEFYMEYRLKRNDGEYRWISDNGVPRFNLDGTFEGYIGACMDIHEKIVYEQKLKEDSERLRLATEAEGLSTWDLDLKTSEIIHSPRLAEIFGHPSAKNITHQSMREQIHPDDRRDIVDKAFEASKTLGVYKYEARIFKPNKSITWIRTQGKVFYDQKNNPVKLIGTLRDITDEKNNQQNLEAREQKFRLLANFMPQFIWTADVEGNINYFNQSFYTYSGLNQTLLDKNGWLQIVHPDDEDRSLKQWQNSIKTGEDFIFEHRFKNKEGIYQWQLSRAIPQKNEAGKIEMWIGTSTNIQDQKLFAVELEKQVKLRTKELKSLNEELESFAYVSSHDLQEPLRKIQTFANRILEKEYNNLTDNGKNYFNRMQESANKMQTLIEDLLAYSRTNSAENIFKNTDLGVIIEEVKNDLKEVFIEKNATIEIGKMEDAVVIPFQFRQIIQNLIGNSLKFAKADIPCHISIKSEIIEAKKLNLDTSNQALRYCHISVADNGIGFELQYKDRIFEVFQRLHGKAEYKGTGIGLAIVKKIIDNHNGFITATGELNKGATFDIYIPSA